MFFEPLLFCCGLGADHEIKGAGQIDVELVAINLRAKLCGHPFARIDLQASVLDHIRLSDLDHMAVTPGYERR